MKKKTVYAVFTKTGSGLDYMVKGNFGKDEEGANQWVKNNNIITHPVGQPEATEPVYPNGLFVKKIKY